MARALAVAVVACLTNDPDTPCPSTEATLPDDVQYGGDHARRSIPVRLRTGKRCIWARATAQTHDNRGGFAQTAPEGRGRFCR
jgi:hypothetical protein